MKNLSTHSVANVKIVLFYACLMPFARLLADGFAGRLGPDPVADITHTTGIWALRLLLAMLAFTPIIKLSGWHWLARLRRTVALYAFFYACLHLSSYLLFEQSFDWSEIAKDIGKRPYISAGFASFALMVPLAATSTNAMMRRLGGRNWQRLV
jgi:sulfoxide reductase heme-binding subunit YedZ